MHKLLSIIIFCLLIGACHRNNETDSALSNADRLIFSAPDSAVTILDSLSTDNMSGFQRAHHALLQTKIREKAGIIIQDTPTDSALSSSIAALSEAAALFQNRGDSLEAQTLFYLGVLLGYRGDYSDALISLMESSDISKNNNDHFYLAMVYREQADIYYQLLAHKKRIELSKLAASHFELADRPLHSVWEKVEIAYSFAITQKADSAINLLKDIQSEVIRQENSNLTADWLRAYALASYQRADYSSSIDHLKGLSNLGISFDSNDHYIMGMSYHGLHNLDSATVNLNCMSDMLHYKSDTLSMVRLKSLIAAESGNPSQALKLNEEFIRRKGVITDNVISNPYVSILENYYHNITDSKTRQLKYQKSLLSIIIIFSLLIIVSAAILFYRKNKKNKLRISKLMKDIRTFEAQLNELHQFNIDNGFAVSLLTKWLESYAHICEEFYFLPSSALLKDKSKSSILKTLSETDTLLLIENIANKSKDNIMQRFRKMAPDLKERQYILAMLIFLNFSTEAICTILNVDRKNTISVLKHRLKNTLLSLNNDDLKGFIQYF